MSRKSVEMYGLSTRNGVPNVPLSTKGETVTPCGREVDLAFAFPLPFRSSGSGAGFGAGGTIVVCWTRRNVTFSWVLANESHSSRYRGPS